MLDIVGLPQKPDADLPHGQAAGPVTQVRVHARLPRDQAFISDWPPADDEEAVMQVLRVLLVREIEIPWWEWRRATADC